MNGWTVGLDYVQALAWPGVLVFVAWRFHDQVAGLLDRLRKLTTPAGSAEFDQEARDLAADARAAEAEQIVAADSARAVETEQVVIDSQAKAPLQIPTTPQDASAKVEIPASDLPETSGPDLVVRQSFLAAWTTPEFQVYRNIAAIDPTSAVTGAWRRVEQFAHVALRERGFNEPWRPQSAMIKQLREAGLGPHFLEVADELRRLRNGVEHGQSKISAAGALDYIDAAERLADALVILLQKQQNGPPSTGDDVP